MFGIAKHQPMTFDATHAVAESLSAEVANAAEITREAVRTALSPSNGLSEQQAFAAALWAEVRFESGY
jgi:hypothetical protein